MASIVERIGALAGTEMSKAVDLAHRTYQDRLDTHRHVGRALVETVAEICRNHPHLVGIGAGLLVEQLLVHEKGLHEARVEAREAAAEGAPADAGVLVDTPTKTVQEPDGTVALVEAQPSSDAAPRNAHLPHNMIKLSDLHPRKVAFEVFAGILLLKLAATGAKMFRHKHQGEVWFAPAARIHLFSGSIAAYNLVSAVRSPNVSAWRNGAILFFGTDALKPILKPTRRKRDLPPRQADRLQ